jgi:hypothetical protein
MSVLAGFREYYFTEGNFGLFEADPENIFPRLVIGDKTWIHHLDSETKQKSRQ